MSIPGYTSNEIIKVGEDHKGEAGLPKSTLWNFIKEVLTQNQVKGEKNIYPLIEVIQNNNTIIDCIIEIINVNENDQLTSENKTNKTVTILQNLLQYNIDLFDFIYDFEKDLQFHTEPPIPIGDYDWESAYNWGD